MNVERLDEKAVEMADIVFLSAMIVQKDSFAKVVKLCNELKTPVVAGGPYPTSLYQEIEGVDYFVLNEAEITLKAFIKDYENGTARKIYTNDKKPELTETPVPMFDLIDTSNYMMMTLQHSRGCPFNCEFCDITEMYGRKTRTKPIPQFLSEIEAVYNTGFTGIIFIVDDNFIGNKKNIKQLLRSIIKWQKENNHPFAFTTEASIDIAQDDELLDLMASAGFINVFIGIESPDPDVLKILNKLPNYRVDMQESIKKIQEKGLGVLGGFILGLDGDPNNIFDLQLDFIKEACIPMAMVGLLEVFPKTRLHRRMVEENRFKGFFIGNNTFKVNLNYIPEMPEKQLIDGYKRTVEELYEPGNYFQRCLALIKRFPKYKKNKRPMKKRLFLLIIVMSVLKQGFSYYGFYYIKYLILCLLHNYRYFDAALYLAIYGEHFIRTKDDFLNS
jgi:radical SAM superfamily enzyme YgiQ (UPF0313 family)